MPEYIPDVLDQWEQRELKQQKELDRLPECSECGHPIQSEFCYEINDELICEQCMSDHHRKAVEDYVS